MDHRHAQVFLDSYHPQRAVTPHAGENDADGLFILVGGQVPEEEVDRPPQPPRCDRFEHLEIATQDGQVGVGWDHVDAVRLDLHPVLHLDDFHLGMPSEEFWNHAPVRWLKMLHEDECHPRIGGQMGKELLECLQPARRRTYPYNVKNLTGAIRLDCFRWRGGGPIRLLVSGFLHRNLPCLCGDRWKARSLRGPQKQRR